MQMSRELLFHRPARSGRPRDGEATGAFVLGALPLVWSAFAKEAFTVQVVAAAVLTLAAVLCLVGSVPDARPGSTPAGTAT